MKYLLKYLGLLNLHGLQRLAGLGVVEQILRHDGSILVDLGEKLKPQDGHFFFHDSLRLKLRQLDKREMEALDQLVVVEIVDDIVVVFPLS